MWQSIHIVERAHRPALSEHLESHPLADIALRAAVDDERLRGPAQHVDEAGGDSKTRGIDLNDATGVFARSHCDDPVAIDRDISDEWHTAGAVVDRPVADENVVLRPCWAQARDREHHKTKGE